MYDRFKDLRENYYDGKTGKQLTQQQLADIFKQKYNAQISQQSIGRLERTGKRPSPQILECYSDFFNVSVEWLLGKSETKSSDPDIKAICKMTGLREDAINMLISQNRLNNIMDHLCEAQGISTDSFFVDTPTIETRKKNGHIKLVGDIKKILSSDDQDFLEAWLNTPDGIKRRFNIDTLSDLIVHASDSIRILLDFFNDGLPPFKDIKCDRITIIGECNGTITAVKDLKRTNNGIVTNPVDNRYI